jgi:hypothetical protein
MRFLRALGFRRADEMDMHVTQIAVRTSWIAITIVLLIWSIFDLVTEGSITRPLILLAMGQAIYFGTMLYMRKKLGDGHQEQTP